MKAQRAVWVLLLQAMLAVSAAAASGQQPATTELEQKAEHAHGSECVHLCMQLSRQLLEDANRHFESGDVKAAHALIDASVHYASRSTDCSVQAHKGEKNTDIELRKLIRRMKDVMQTLDSDDRPHVSNCIAELEQERDKVLRAMFGAAAGGRASEKKP